MLFRRDDVAAHTVADFFERGNGALFGRDYLHHVEVFDTGGQDILGIVHARVDGVAQLIGVALRNALDPHVFFGEGARAQNIQTRFLGGGLEAFGLGLQEKGIRLGLPFLPRFFGKACRDEQLFRPDFPHARRVVGAVFDKPVQRDA